MEKSRFVQSGQIGSALVAIVIAGCLIKKEQDTSVLATPSDVLVAIEKSPSEPSVETSANPVLPPIANAPVMDIALTVDGTVITLSELEPDELKKVLETVDQQVMGPTLFNTSKSMIPPVDEEQYYMFVMKEDHKHIVNYTFLHSDTWKITLNDLERFYAMSQGTVDSCELNIQYSKNSAAFTDLTMLQSTEIYRLLQEIDMARNNDILMFSSSKSLSAPIESDEYIFTVTRGEEKSDYSALYIDSDAWETLRTEIIECSFVSMDYLYIVEP